MITHFKNNYFIYTLIFVALLVDLLFFSYTLEDAQITYRYSLRFSEGYDFGMWNRTGKPVEGFTTFLWMVYLSIFGPEISNIVYASKITGIICHLLLIALFFSLHIRTKNENYNYQNLFSLKPKQISKVFLFVSISLSIFIPLSWYSSTGMETLLFICLIAYAFFLPFVTKNIYILSFIVCLLILTRPDGLIFAIGAPIYFYYFSKDNRYIKLIVMAILVFLTLTMFRFQYFGHLMPNTYYAKSENSTGLMHFKYGILYFGAFVLSFIYLIVPIIINLFQTVKSKSYFKDSFLMYLILGISVYFLIVAKAGADNFSAFPYWRHILNIFPLLLFVTFYSIHKIFKNESKYMASVLILLLLSPIIITVPSSLSKQLRETTYTQLQSFPKITNDFNNNELFKWLKKNTDNNTIISTSLAGELPLTIDAVHIDVLGLNNEFIAHNGTFDPKGPVDSKSNMAYVIKQKPDIIEGYMDAKNILNDYKVLEAITKSRKKMNLELLTNKEFKENYLIIENAPYEYFNRILFVNKAYLKKSKKHEENIKTRTLDGILKYLQ